MFRADRMTVLSESECHELLREHQLGVGRLGFDDGMPTILPVNYVVDGNNVVIRTGEGTKLDAALEGQVVAFEIDSVRASRSERQGWSVLVRGRARHVVAEEELAFLRLSRLEADAGGLKGHFIAIDMQQVTGRRF